MDFTGIQKGLLLSDQFINIPPNIIVPGFMYFSQILPFCNMPENIFIQT